MKVMRLEGMPSIDVPLYGGRIYLIANRRDYNRAVAAERGIALRQRLGHKKNDLHGMDGHFDAFVGQKKGDRIYLIGVFNGCIGTLAHEIYHVAYSIEEMDGVTPGGEASAYLIGSLMREAQRVLKCK